MRNLFCMLAALLTASLFAACDLSTNMEEAEAPVFSPPLRAVATASSASGTPLVKDSYYDDTGNYYLIDVGNVRNAYVSTLFLKHYNGVTPITASVTNTVESAVTKAVTTSVSKSITASATIGVKKELAASVKASAPGAEVGASAKFEWNASLTASRTDTESESELYSEVQRISTSETTAVTIGEHNEPAGHYRYALYAVCDVYFLVKTSRDNHCIKEIRDRGLRPQRNDTALF